MLDWIFEGIVTWISSIVAELMDAVSGLFLDALGTDMTAMEEYFPFVEKAFIIMQYTAWSLIFLMTVWKLFRIFAGPLTESEGPWTLLARSRNRKQVVLWGETGQGIRFDSLPEMTETFLEVWRTASQTHEKSFHEPKRG